MTCVICMQAEPEPGTATFTLEPDSAILVLIRDVPARVCPNCGETYTGEETTQLLLAIAEEAKHAGVQVDIRRYQAA